MRLGTRMRYGTRAMLFLALHAAEGPCNVQEIADDQNLSVKYLEQLMSALLAKGLVQYELVYGSLSTVVSLMFWIYLISTITIFCAHLSAVIELKWGKKQN